MPIETIKERKDIFALIGYANRELRINGLAYLTEEYTDRVCKCDTYEEALMVTREYVDIE